MFKIFFPQRFLGQMFCFLFFFLFIFGFLRADIIHTFDYHKLKLKDCLLPKDHPIQDNLKTLFNNPDMFQSSEHLQLAGFSIFDKMRRGLMVASHPYIKGYLIKKFQDSVPLKQQLHNYLKRIHGARALREFIRMNNMQHIVVPQKWLYQLPKSFSDPNTKEKPYVLIVEEIDICSGGKDHDGEVAERYYDIDFDVLRELCMVVYYFRGLDSGIQNMPFTYQNKIAFIDTEHWQNNKREGFLRFAMSYMSQDRQEYVMFFKQLLEQDKSDE